MAGIAVEATSNFHTKVDVYPKGVLILQLSNCPSPVCVRPEKAKNFTIKCFFGRQSLCICLLQAIGVYQHVVHTRVNTMCQQWAPEMRQLDKAPQVERHICFFTQPTVLSEQGMAYRASLLQNMFN